MAKIKQWWAALAYWLTHRRCTKCSKEEPRKLMTKNLFILDGKWTCTQCVNKFYDRLREEKYEEKVERELENLRAKEDARRRFAVEQANLHGPAYRVPARVEDEHLLDAENGPPMGKQKQQN